MEHVMPRAAAFREAIDGAKTAELHKSHMLSVAEACQYLRVSKWTLYRLIQGKQLKTIKIGSRRLIPMQSLQDFIHQLEAKAGA